MRSCIFLLGLTLTVCVRAEVSATGPSPRLTSFCSAALELGSVGQPLDVRNVGELVGKARTRIDETFVNSEFKRPASRMDHVRAYLRSLKPFAADNVHVSDVTAPDQSVGQGPADPAADRGAARLRMDALGEVEARLAVLEKQIAGEIDSDVLDGRVIEGRQRISSHLEHLRTKTFAFEARQRREPSFAPAAAADAEFEMPKFKLPKFKFPKFATPNLDRPKALAAAAKEKLNVLRSNRYAQLAAYGVGAVAVTGFANHVHPALGVVTSLAGLGGLYYYLGDVVKKGFLKVSALYADALAEADRSHHEMATAFVARSSVEMQHLDLMIESLAGFERSNAFSYFSTTVELPLSADFLATEPGAATAIQQALLDDARVAPLLRGWVRIEYVLFKDEEGQKLYYFLSEAENPVRAATAMDVYAGAAWY